MRIAGGLANLSDVSTAKGRPLVTGCAIEDRFGLPVESDSPTLPVGIGVGPIHLGISLDDLMVAKAKPLVTMCGIGNRFGQTAVSEQQVAESVDELTNNFASPIRCGLQLGRFIHAMASFKKVASFDSMSVIPSGDTLSQLMQGVPVTPLRDPPSLGRTEYLI